MKNPCGEILKHPTCARMRAGSSSNGGHCTREKRTQTATARLGHIDASAPRPAPKPHSLQGRTLRGLGPFPPCHPTMNAPIWCKKCVAANCECVKDCSGTRISRCFSKLARDMLSPG